MNQETKTGIARCRKKGKMNHGRIFAYKDKLYEYLFTPEPKTHQYNVKTEGKEYANHSMTIRFFEEYFQPTDKIELDEELFEI